MQVCLGLGLPFHIISWAIASFRNNPQVTQTTRVSWLFSLMCSYSFKNLIHEILDNYPYPPSTEALYPPMMFVEKSLGPSLVELCLIQAFDPRTSVALDSQISPRSSGDPMFMDYNK